AILDLVRGTGPELARAQNVGVFFAKDFEVPSNGALVLWVPALSKSGSVQEGNEDADEREIARFKRSAGKLLDRMSRNSVSQPLVLALPERYDGKFSEEELLAELEDRRPEAGLAPRIVYHRFTDPEPLEGEDPDEHAFDGLDGGRRWLLFVDGFSVARLCQPFTSAGAISQEVFDHWLTVFRDHGRPAERVLPDVIREVPEDDEDAGEDD
ncbi:MAG: hypothetical protein AAGG01_15755, partial [Planctomycetota bacterium]